MEMLSGSVGAMFGGLVALFAVWLTNRHQSVIAAKSRNIAALSSFNAAILSISRNEFSTLEELRSLTNQAESAGYQIRVDMKCKELAEELFEWPLTLGYMAKAGHELRQQASYAFADEVRVLMARAVTDITNKTTKWAEMSPRKHARWVYDLTKERESFHSAAKQYHKKVLPSRGAAGQRGVGLT